MAKNEYKLQVSKKYNNGIIWLVRGDDLDELMKGLSFVRTFLSEEELLKEGVAPRVKQQDMDISQDPDDFDPTFCYIHDVPMTEFSKDRTQADGTVQTSRWFSHKQGDDWCKGK